MTTETNDTVERYTVSGVGPYAYSFRVFDEDELTVTAISAGLVATTLAITTDYTVAGVDDEDGGTITLVAGTATTYAGYALDIRSNTIEYQPTSIRNQGSFLPEVHEDAFDRLSRQIQDLSRKVRGSLRYPDDGITDAVVPAVSSRAGRYLFANAVTGAFEWVTSILTTALSQSIFNQYQADSDPYKRTDAEIAAVVTPTDYAIPSHDAVGYAMPARYGLVNDSGASDQTSILNSAYAVAAEARCPLRLPAWTIRFTSKLEWDQSVDVEGESFEFSVLRKFGSFDGIEISGVGGQAHYRNFTVYSTEASDTTGRGIVVSEASSLKMDRVYVRGHGSHGLHLDGAGPTGFFARYSNIVATENGGDGVRVGSGHFAAMFDTVDSRGNTGWGFNLLASAAYHNAKAIVCQQNTAGGTQVAGQQNVLELYGEANTGVDISLTAASVRNLITNYHVDTYPGDLVDAGTNNIILSVSGIPAMLAPTFTLPSSAAGVAGRQVAFAGAHAGTDGAAAAGGAALLTGGDAGGTGNANGGIAYVEGGPKVGTGRVGDVVIQRDGTGLTVIGAATPTAAAAVLELISTTRGFLMPKMTTAQKNAIASAPSGLEVYDTTLGKKCFVNNSGVWETITSA